MPPEGRNAAYLRDIVDPARTICDFTNTVSLADEVVLMKDRGGRVNRIVSSASPSQNRTRCASRSKS
jgi:hypothetical protein